MGGSNIRISVVVAVSIAGVIRGIAVGGVAVGGVGSIGRGAAIGVGGRGDHGVTGSSAHVHLLTNAPLILISGTSMTISISGRRVAISIGGVAVSISVGWVAVTSTIAITVVNSIPTIAS